MCASSRLVPSCEKMKVAFVKVHVFRGHYVFKKGGGVLEMSMSTLVSCAQNVHMTLFTNVSTF